MKAHPIPLNLQSFLPSLVPELTNHLVADILNYALTLEHLEDKFYRDGLSQFSEQDFANAGFDATFYGNLKEVSSDETTHVKFLTTALEGKKFHAPVIRTQKD